MHYANNDYPKERLTSNFLSCNSFLSAWEWTESLPAQWAGVDLSCTTPNGQQLFVDLKLKNTGFGTAPTAPSNRWSLEIYRNKNGHLVEGWLCKAGQLTNVYCYVEAFGENWTKLDRCELYFFDKQSTIARIENDTKRSIADISHVARWMLETGRKYYKLSDALCLSMTQRDADNATVNLCFDRQYITTNAYKVDVYRKHTV